MRVDLRSDTVTQPSKAMKEAMVNAELGDDVWGDDPTVQQLEAKLAKMLGKEAGLFFPSGTMSNLCAMMCWTSRGEAALLGDGNHICFYEQGGISGVGGAFTYQCRSNPDGTLDLDELEYKLKNHTFDKQGDLDYHHCGVRVVCLENPHTLKGGRVSSIEYQKQVKDLCDKYGVGLHLDGARMLNAVHALGMYNEAGLLEFSAPFDSISFCLSKGIGAPVGSVLLGTSDLIKRARRIRKSLGGGLRQVGLLAAAGLYGLEHIAPKMNLDHERAKKLHKFLTETCGLQVDACETNMVFAKIPEPTEFCKVMETVGVLVCSPDGVSVRFAFHHQVTDEMLDYMMEQIKDFLSKQ